MLRPAASLAGFQAKDMAMKAFNIFSTGARMPDGRVHIALGLTAATLTLAASIGGVILNAAVSRKPSVPHTCTLEAGSCRASVSVSPAAARFEFSRRHAGEGSAR